jgi:glycosyltransferase involved in cell wall biosynthesis
VTPRLAVLPDYREEGWPSMDLCADMLLAHLPPAVVATAVSPPFRRVAGTLPALGRTRAAFNADRLLNRFVLFPRHARRAARHFDLFHIADHTYAQLVHALPADRTGVYCHDLDAFRCLLDPARDPRPGWFRALARRTLAGLRKAAVVFHSTAAVRAELVAAGLVDPARLVAAPYGVAPEFTADPGGATPAWADRVRGRPWVAHVGSCAPRKRIDVLLDVVARLREVRPGLALVKAGGEWSGEHAARIARLGLGDAAVHLQGLTRADLAEVYRRAPVVLVPSEAEGFGLPVIEALACGSAVVASDLPALREAGGPAAVYAPVGDVAAWADAVGRVLDDPAAAAPRADRLAWAARFSWRAHAAAIAGAYLALPGRPCG